MNNQKLFIDETEEIISYDDIKNHFENDMEEWEREEYNNNFEEYLICCMYWNGGTLTPIIQGGMNNSKAEVFNQSFADDAEKMIDFNTLTKEEFLQSYSYLTEAEYEATLQEVNGIK